MDEAEKLINKWLDEINEIQKKNDKNNSEIIKACTDIKEIIRN